MVLTALPKTAGDHCAKSVEDVIELQDLCVRFDPSFAARTRRLRWSARNDKVAQSCLVELDDAIARRDPSIASAFDRLLHHLAGHNAQVCPSSEPLSCLAARSAICAKAEAGSAECIARVFGWAEQLVCVSMPAGIEGDPLKRATAPIMQALSELASTQEKYRSRACELLEQLLSKGFSAAKWAYGRFVIATKGAFGIQAVLSAVRSQEAWAVHALVKLAMAGNEECHAACPAAFLAALDAGDIPLQNELFAWFRWELVNIVQARSFEPYLRQEAEDLVHDTLSGMIKTGYIHKAMEAESLRALVWKIAKCLLSKLSKRNALQHKPMSDLVEEGLALRDTVNGDLMRLMAEDFRRFLRTNPEYTASRDRLEQVLDVVLLVGFSSQLKSLESLKPWDKMQPPMSRSTFFEWRARLCAAFWVYLSGRRPNLPPAKVSRAGGVARTCGCVPPSQRTTRPDTTWSGPGQSGGQSPFDRGCPTRDEITLAIENAGNSGGDDESWIAAHIGTCDACAELFAELLLESEVPSSVPAVPLSQADAIAFRVPWLRMARSVMGIAALLVLASIAWVALKTPPRARPSSPPAASSAAMAVAGTPKLVGCSNLPLTECIEPRGMETSSQLGACIPAMPSAPKLGEPIVVTLYQHGDDGVQQAGISTIEVDGQGCVSLVSASGEPFDLLCMGGAFVPAKDLHAAVRRALGNQRLVPACGSGYQSDGTLTHDEAVKVLSSLNTRDRFRAAATLLVQARLANDSLLSADTATVARHVRAFQVTCGLPQDGAPGKSTFPALLDCAQVDSMNTLVRDRR